MNLFSIRALQNVEYSSSCISPKCDPRIFGSNPGEPQSNKLFPGKRFFPPNPPFGRTPSPTLFRNTPPLGDTLRPRKKFVRGRAPHGEVFFPTPLPGAPRGGKKTPQPAPQKLPRGREDFPTPFRRGGSPKSRGGAVFLTAPLF